MNIFSNDTKSRKTLSLLKMLFILSGLLQGVAVIFTTVLCKELFSGNVDQSMTWVIYTGITAFVSFIFYYIGVNIGNHMSVWEVCDSKVRQVGRSIIKLPLGWFDASSKGKVSKAISTDINNVAHYPPIVLPEILTVLSSSLVIGVALIVISYKYGIILLVMIPLMFYFWKENLAVLRSIEKENVTSNQQMESTVVEFAQLQPVLRASGALLGGWDKLDKALTDDRNATIKTLKKKGKNTFRYMFVVDIGSILILVLSALELKSGVMEIHTFVGIVIAMLRFSNPLASLIGFLAEVFNVESALGRIRSITEAKTLPETTDLGEVEADSEGFSIEFKDVDFSYIEGTPVLNKINLKIPADSITALVGASGSGKSTINKLIARFWDVDSGGIFINGKNIKDIKTEKLMRLISMVFQEVYLFDTTIKENVGIAKPNATEEEIFEAAKKARLDEVIERLPNGWDTKVGEGGSSLSGGEKQRVSIARAFLKDAPILLLDEITSALDGINEAVITKSLEELSNNRTVIVIAHRLSSIKNSDKIAVIDGGKILAYDSHDNLLKTNEQYQNLWSALVRSKKWKL